MLSFAAIALLFQACADHCPPDTFGTYSEALQQLGTPDHEHIVEIYEGMSLYEYQGGLYDHVRKGDTIFVVETVWQLDNTKFIVWHQLDNQQLLDRLCIPPDVHY